MRAMLWDAIESHAPEWCEGVAVGESLEGSILWVVSLAAACYYGERLMLALLVAGSPTARQNDEMSWQCLS